MPQSLLSAAPYGDLLLAGTYGIAQCAVPIDLPSSYVAEPGYERSGAPLIRHALEIFDHGDFEDIHAIIESARIMNV
jgi:hypothetical protein